jgi:hypothetical protein
MEFLQAFLASVLIQTGVVKEMATPRYLPRTDANGRKVDYLGLVKGRVIGSMLWKGMPKWMWESVVPTTGEFTNGAMTCTCFFCSYGLTLWCTLDGDIGMVKFAPFPKPSRMSALQERLRRLKDRNKQLEKENQELKNRLRKLDKGGK